MLLSPERRPWQSKLDSFHDTFIAIYSGFITAGGHSQLQLSPALYKLSMLYDRVFGIYRKFDVKTL